jgi:hypothetical protein
MFPLESTAMLVTGVVPTGKYDPLAGTDVTFVTPQLSVALTVKLTLVPHWPADTTTTMLLGQMITGGCVSLTVTVKLAVAVLDDVSVIV